MELQRSIGKLMALQDKMSAYRNAMSLMNYDGDTTAPKGTAKNRAHAMGVLSSDIYTMNTSEETLSLLNELDEHREELDGKTARMTQLMLKEIRRMQKIPKDEYVSYRKLMVESSAVWHEAKEKSDFSLFEPYLQQVFDAKKKFASYCAPDMRPYDYWLGQYEEGLTMEDCGRFFDTLRAHIVPLVKAIAGKPQLSDSMVKGHFSDDVQEKFAYHLMKTIGLDLSHVGLGTTEHPFTTSIGSHHDVRITTRYVPERFDWSMFSVIHEGGHALYESHPAEEFAYTVLDGGVSMSIHESQSRFYENIIGRSRAFCKLIFPKLQELFPENTAGKTAEDFYQAINKVEPTLIRTEADEVTYSLHVMIRYELEKRIFDGTLTVPELPGEWNRLYREYLGIEVPDDKRGVLQDSHWSTGLVGYFPSYALGSAYGAQFLKKMKEDIDVEACIEKGDFGPVNAWNEEKIWQYGKLYTPAEILRRVIGGSFDPTVYTSYLEEKYGELYGL